MRRTANKVTIGISSPAEAKARMLGAFRGKAQRAFIGFASAELLWKVIGPKRWAIVRAMTGAGPVAIREVARRVGRDVKPVPGPRRARSRGSVHGDVRILLKAGVLDRTPDGRVEFPYDEVHVDFVLRAAAE